MRSSRCLGCAVALTLAAPVLVVGGASAAHAADPAPTELALVRETPAQYAAVFHDDVDAGPQSLPGVDVVDYRATLTSDGTPVAGAPVRLLRLLATGTTWRTVSTVTTDSHGVADFSTPVRGNAQYEASYDGSATTATATSGPLTLTAMRDFNAELVQNSSGVYLRGDINPGWSRRVVSWQRRTCATCRWRTLTKARATRTGGWRFQGSFPRGDRTWWFRAKLVATPAFATSTSSMLVTRGPTARRR